MKDFLTGFPAGNKNRELPERSGKSEYSFIGQNLSARPITRDEFAKNLL